MVHFNIPSLWKAGVLFNLCLHQGSHVPHFTSAHTRTHTHRPSCRAPQPLLLNFRYGNYRNVTVLMCWMTKSNALLHTQLWKLFRREPSTTAMGYGFLSFINKKPCLFTLKTSFSSLFFLRLSSELLPSCSGLLFPLVWTNIYKTNKEEKENCVCLFMCCLNPLQSLRRHCEGICGSGIIASTSLVSLDIK